MSKFHGQVCNLPVRACSDGVRGISNIANLGDTSDAAKESEIPRVAMLSLWLGDRDAGGRRASTISSRASVLCLSVFVRDEFFEIAT